jgi:transposase-like protein
MFSPPRCPNRDCPMHADPAPDFYIRKGFYSSGVKAQPVQRFRCRDCQRGFSRQTFRHDYRDKKPHLNVRIVEHLCSGVGYRQTARIVCMTRRNVLNKARKIQRTAKALDTNLLHRAGEVDRAAPSASPLRVQFDEFESYEMCRNTMPLSIPTAVESVSRLILGAVAAPIRPRGKMTPKRLKRIQRHEESYGARVDLSPGACQEVLDRAAAFRPAAPQVRLDTDQKATYPRYAKLAFSESKLVHRTTPGSSPRNGRSRLAAINLTEAMMRDLGSRVRRESWLTSKKCCYLNLHLGLYIAWRNWVRPRFNRDTRCPGEIAGFAARRLGRGELLSWRQDWGQRSPSPYGRGAVAIGEEWEAKSTAA